MNLKFFESVLGLFLYKGSIFATLQLSGKEAGSMERLQILAIGVQSIFGPSLRNLPARLSTPVAFLVLNCFKIFRIDTEITFSNLSFFPRNKEGIPNFPIGSGSFLTRSLARFAKCFLKVFTIVLGKKCQLFFIIEAYACCGSLFVW